MPRSFRSFRSSTPPGDEDRESSGYNNTQNSQGGLSASAYTQRPRSSRHHRRTYSARSTMDENSGLLDNPDGRSYRSLLGPPTPGTPKFQRQPSYSTNARVSRSQALKKGDSYGFSQRLVDALQYQRQDQGNGSGMSTSKSSNFYIYDRGWYDQFTSTDWVRDTINDAFRIKELHSQKGLGGRLRQAFDAAQGWILVAIIGLITANVAYFVNITEGILFDYKNGFCERAWFLSRKACCAAGNGCSDWRRWSEVVTSSNIPELWIDYIAFIVAVCFFSFLAFTLTMLTKTVIPSQISLSTLDENLAASRTVSPNGTRGTSPAGNGKQSPSRKALLAIARPPMVYYPAAGSGVAEIKVIVSGFVLHGYLGMQTLVIKTVALILSVASGLSVGKEGPFVHIATCVGNICCRLFSKYYKNDMKRREALSAAAASGVAVAFGAPIAGVLFSLEEVSYYFPSKTLFRTFFCCIIAALSLKFLNPYGTGKIVLFEVRYITDWKAFEMVIFVILGVLGGALGAFFIKATQIWATTFRRVTVFKKYPGFEVFLVALITGVLSFWNRYTNLPVTELLFELASPCDAYTESGMGLCPTREQIPSVIWYLCIAFVIKALLTTITFGIKVPAGIYVPSMVVGGLLGRIVGHSVQWFALTYSESGLFGTCNPNGAPEDCVVPGVYAMVAAGATMCGVTRLSVTLAVILFELTGSLEHVLPFSIGVLVSKWTADWIEPRSIYDLLTDMNSYPFLDNKHRPSFDSELGDILPRMLQSGRLIDITASPLVPATDLRGKLELLHACGEVDGGLPILRDGKLVGLIPAPDLEYALDQLDNEGNSLCLMAPDAQWINNSQLEEEENDPTDFTAFIDPAPVALDIKSPMDLVYECFVKLGLRYVCAIRDGEYAGMVHKKSFVKYCKDIHDKQG